jgi:hypothetical protein
MHTEDYDGATMATFDEHAHDTDSGAYPRSQVAQMYSGSCAESDAASGTPVSRPCFTRRRVLARPTCRTAAAPIVRRNSLRARRGARKIALRHNAVCIEAGLLRPSGRWLHPYGADGIPCCFSKCRTSSRPLDRISTMPSSPRSLRKRCVRMRIRRRRTRSRLAHLHTVLGTHGT